MKDIVLWDFPIYIPKRITFLATTDSLLKGFTKGKQVVHLLAYRHKPLLSREFFESCHCRMDILC